MSQAAEFLSKAQNRRVGVRVTYFSDLDIDQLNDRVAARAKGKDIPLTERRIDLQSLTSGFFTALAEMARLNEAIPAEEQTSELTMRLQVLQHMLAEVMGNELMSIQTVSHELDDLVPFDQQDVAQLQSIIDSYVFQSQNPEWSYRLRELGLDAASMLNDLIDSAIDDVIGGKQGLNLNFLTASALGIQPQDLVAKTLKMERTKAFLLKMVGSDLPLIRASIVHTPLLEVDNVLSARNTRLEEMDAIARGANSPIVH